MFELEPGESVEAGIKRILSEKVEETIQLLRFPGEDPALSIHEARKNFKRLRAVLRLVRDEIGPAHYFRENVFFRNLGRKLAPLRDSEVMLETYDRLHLEEYFKNAPIGMGGLRVHLDGHKLEVHERFFDHGEGFEEMVSALEISLENMALLPIRNEGFEALAGGFKRVYRRGRRRMARAYGIGNDPHLFHEWRKRVKYLWHHYEILRPIEPDWTGQRIEQLQILSGFLGEAHDAALMWEYLQQHPGYKDNLAAQFVIEQAIRNHGDLTDKSKPLGLGLFWSSPREVVMEISRLWFTWVDKV